MKVDLEVKHGSYHSEFPFWYRPLWDWLMGMVKDPQLAPHFVWDAVKLEKFDGHQFVRFIHEAWTAERFWEFQVCPLRQFDCSKIQ